MFKNCSVIRLNNNNFLSALNNSKTNYFYKFSIIKLKNVKYK